VAIGLATGTATVGARDAGKTLLTPAHQRSAAQVEAKIEEASRRDAEVDAANHDRDVRPHREALRICPLIA